MGHCLGIDVGTTNAKAALVADDGTILASATRPIPTLGDGEVAEQDPEALWGAVVGAVGAATAAAPAAAAAVDAVLCASQYSSTVPVDEHGDPTARLKLYLDHRGTDHCFAIMEREPDSLVTFVERHGVPPVGGGLSLAHLLHFQLDEPDVHGRTTVYLEPVDFVNLRLTGQVAATQCTMLMSQLCDNRTLDATGYDAELVRLAGIDATRLPPLVPIDAVVGTVLPEVGAILGLPAGIPVYAGVNDSQAAAIGTGAFRTGRIGAMIGTTSVLLEITDHLATDLDHEIVATPSPLPGRYVVFAENGLGGKALEHVLAHLVYASDALADHLAADHFERLDATLEVTPAGSNGVLFLPWLGGTLSPSADTRMRGGFLNLSLDTGRTHLVRGAVEGISHNFAWLVPHVEAFTGHRIEEVVFAGGAARSHGWAQIMADILDRPVHTMGDPELAGARGVALLALQRAGVLTEADLDRLVPIDATYQPVAARRALYDAMHEQFVAAFDALRPVYHALNS